MQGSNLMMQGVMKARITPDAYYIGFIPGIFATALGTALAGLAGVLVALAQSVTPDVGMEWTIKALIVVVLAGIGSIGGAFFAGLILGIVEAVGAIFMGPYSVALGLVIFLLILMFRPQGLFGKA